MKVETLGQLLNWAAAVHSQLHERLRTGATRSEEGPAKGFIEYAAEHEGRMAQQLAGLADSADAKAMGTWLYDWLDHPPQPPERITGGATDDLSLEAVTRAVLEAHNQVMSLFTQLLPRADIPASKELIQQVIELEESHTRQMAQQMNRIRDM